MTVTISVRCFFVDDWQLKLHDVRPYHWSVVEAWFVIRKQADMMQTFSFSHASDIHKSYRLRHLHRFLCAETSQCLHPLQC